MEENENTVPKTPKSAKKGGRGAQARALPDGFKVEVKKTEKKEWKEYRGPDGKQYNKTGILIPHKTGILIKKTDTKHQEKETDTKFQEKTIMVQGLGIATEIEKLGLYQKI